MYDNDELTRTEAADLIGVHPNTLANLATWGRGPTFEKCGRRAMYRREDVERFIKERERFT
jgi:hypothetical protein